MKNSFPSFPVPEGFVIPEDLKEGQDIEVLGTVQIVDGKMTLVAVDGISLPGREEPKNAKAEDDEEDDGFLSKVQKSLADGGPDVGVEY